MVELRYRSFIFDLGTRLKLVASFPPLQFTPGHLCPLDRRLGGDGRRGPVRTLCRRDGSPTLAGILLTELSRLTEKIMIYYYYYYYYYYY
jgi:hypothetical protein